MKLYDYQLDSIKRMRDGCILCGGVGSGKSRTALAYYYIQQGGRIDPFYPLPTSKDIQPLYIITTARKRDTMEWEEELIPFVLPEKSKVVIDSWNNIKKYTSIKNAFFIFDEQRVVGYGSWTKSFLSITKGNRWILLSATPGDTWTDYIPVFIANGYYKNKTDFMLHHVVYSRFSKFPKVDRYLETGKLNRLRREILVDMKFDRKTISHHQDVIVNYDISSYKDLIKNRWNHRTNQPVTNASELCYEMRRIVNSDISRVDETLEIVEKSKRAIIFYNFDYELEILKNVDWPDGFEVAEWNGHKHQPVPSTRYWVYLVQYTSGAEGWNCVATDTIIFFSQNYSYKVMVQSSGRIDRLNTPFKDLYYYHLKSRSSIDISIARALKNKKKFNEEVFVNGM